MIESSNDTDQDANDDRDPNPLQREREREIESSGSTIGGQYANQYSNDRPDQPKNDRFNKEQLEYVPVLKPHGLHDSDLTGSFGNVHEHDVCDPDRTDDQRDDRNPGNEARERVGDALNLLDEPFINST